MSRRQKFFQILMALALTASLLAPLTNQVNAKQSRIQPELARITAESPEQLLSVIVQTADGGAQVERAVERFGGKVTKDLHFIDAFAALVPASAVSKVAAYTGVRWVSLDAPMVLSDDDGDDDDEQYIDTSQLENAYNFTVEATEVWNEAPAYLQGQGVTVALVDSGIAKNKELKGRIVKSVSFIDGQEKSKDGFGHGSFLASIIAGDGSQTDGKYIGIAPQVSLVDLDVADDQGMGTESDVIAALQWIYENKEQYNVRVVNLSVNSSVAQDYHTSPLCLGIEILWLNGVVVVVSAGNNGDDTLYPPANDPFAITVGATDDGGTADLTDDTMTSFSAYGFTSSGAAKPDLVAPGTDVVAYLPKHKKMNVSQKHSEHQVGEDAFRMSGTSVAAPMVTGAVALLLQDEPNLTPDQVKFRLMATANQNWPGYNATNAGTGYLDIHTAVHGSTTEFANEGELPHMVLMQMALIAYWASENGGQDIDWEAVNWNAVNWNAVNWNAVNWNAVNWNAVNWNAVNWNAVNWNAVNWNAVNWNAVNWNAVNWNAVNWNAVNWNAVNWNSQFWGD